MTEEELARKIIDLIMPCKQQVAPLLLRDRGQKYAALIDKIESLCFRQAIKESDEQEIEKEASVGEEPEIKPKDEDVYTFDLTLSFLEGYAQYLQYLRAQTGEKHVVEVHVAHSSQYKAHVLGLSVRQQDLVSDEQEIERQFSQAEIRSVLERLEQYYAGRARVAKEALVKATGNLDSTLALESATAALWAGKHQAVLKVAENLGIEISKSGES